MSVAKQWLRTAKNITKGYSEIQIHFREATSNDPDPASPVILQLLADSTFERQAFVDIVFMIQKRLNDHGKNWRHVYKTLVVLDYFLGFASERMLKYIKEHVHLIKTLREFQYIDENGRDQGVLVREKSKEIMDSLADEETLRLKRLHNLANRPAEDYYDEDAELKRALEESKRTSSVRGSTVTKTQEEKDLEKALELSKKEYEKQMSNVDQIDFFSPMETPNVNVYQPNIQANYPASQQFVPNYGYMQNQPLYNQQQQDFFGSIQPQQYELMNNTNPFGMAQQQNIIQQQPIQQQPFTDNAMFRNDYNSSLNNSHQEQALLEFKKSDLPIDPFAKVSSQKGGISGSAMGNVVSSGRATGSNNPFGASPNIPPSQPFSSPSMKPANAPNPFFNQQQEPPKQDPFMAISMQNQRATNTDPFASLLSSNTKPTTPAFGATNNFSVNQNYSLNNGFGNQGFTQGSPIPKPNDPFATSNAAPNPFASTTNNPYGNTNGYNGNNSSFI